MPASDNTLFAGTAGYYARYRLPYPDELFADLIREFGLDGRGRLLDVGCGTGQITLPLHDVFEEVVAIDPNEEMIAEARRQGEAAGAANLRWLRRAAEEISPALGTFRLVTFGSSLHWTDRERVLRLARELLVNGGGIATSGMPSWWSGQEVWQREVIRIVKQYLGEERRAGSGIYEQTEERHEAVIGRAGFVGLKRMEYRLEHVWDCDSIIGHLYSTSFAAKSLFAGNAPSFERGVREALLRLNPGDEFRETVVVEALLAWKG